MYPLAQRHTITSTTYGPLPDKGMETLALVYHTTETSGIPGFSDGDVAPHYLYMPADRSWWWFGANLNQRVGTMKGSGSTGVYANEKAVQLEIVCYSDKSIADQSASRLWVGDFTEEHYQDLADFYRWIRGEVPIGEEVTSTPPGGWQYGSGSIYRLSTSAWYDFSGLTAHGCVPGQSHWDTGVLDLDLIFDLSMAGDDEEDEVARTLEQWVVVLRSADIQRAADAGIIKQSEVTYWQGLLLKPEGNADEVAAEWINYRDAVEVRRV